MNKPEVFVAFDRVQSQLKARLGVEVYSSWFGRLKMVEASKSIVRMSVPTPFLRAWISNHYMDLIAELWRAELPDVLKVEIVVRSATRAGSESVIAEAEAQKAASKPAIQPLAAGPEVFNRDILVMAGLTLSLFVIGYGFRGPGRINRFEGALLMACYVGYTAFLVGTISS